MAEKEITLRTKYRYKPENGDSYITLYFENGTNDVIVDSDIPGITLANATLTQALLAFVDALKTKAPKTIYDTSRSLRRKNLLLEHGQFAIESDTGKAKIGDGNTRYSNLPYIAGASGYAEDHGHSDPDYVGQITVDETSKLKANIGGDDVTINLQELIGSETPLSDVGAYVHVLDIQHEFILDDTSEVHTKVDGEDVVINLTELVASDTPMPTAKAYVRTIE